MKREYIVRDNYLEKIKPFVNKEIIKVIIGQRRVGKSYLLFQIMDFISKENKNSNIIYINLEQYENNHIKNENDLINEVVKKTKPKVKNYVFIDEIQEVENFEKALRSLFIDNKYDIYCTGSNANLLSSEIATILSGRTIEFKVYSLSYTEFLGFHQLNTGQDSFLKYIKYGGLPFLINLKLEDEIVYNYLSSIYNTILFKDVVERHNVRNIHFLKSLTEYLADNSASIVSAKKISDYLKSQKINISVNVVLNYLSYLEAAFFIFKVKRAAIMGKKIFDIGEKYFFEDIGLRHVLIGYQQSDIHKVLENLVYSHLVSSDFKVNVGVLGNNEIDFICEKKGKKAYFQVTYLMKEQKTHDREFGNLLKIKDNYPKYVISMDQLIGKDEKGIKHLNILDFLSQFPFEI